MKNKKPDISYNIIYYTAIILSLSVIFPACDFFNGKTDVSKSGINKKIAALLLQAESESDENSKARLYGQASKLLANKGDINQAVKAARKGRRANPMEVHSLATIGEYYISQRRFKEAQIVLEEALTAQSDSSRVNFLLGNAFFADKNTSDASNYYKKAIEYDTRNIDAYTNLAALYVSQGNPSKAVPLLEKAISIQPGFAENYKNAGIAADKAGQASKAVDYYSKYLALNKSGDDRQVVEAWIAKLK